jgi:sulfonate transport system ATP-binding protein
MFLLVTHDVDEALLLADRVLVLTDGRISLDLAIEVVGPRRRDTPTMIGLRSKLLLELGVIEGDEGIRIEAEVVPTPPQ